MKIKSIVVSGFLLFSSVHVLAGEKLDFFKKPPPADRPVKFAENVISHPDTHEEKIAFSDGGKEIIFGRHKDTLTKETYFSPKVMRTFSTDEGWSEPKAMDFAEGRQIGWPMTSLSGSVLFLEEYEGKIVKSEKVNGEWSDFNYVKPDVEAVEGFGLAQITDDNTFYFHDRYGRIAYSSSIVDGEYSKPVELSYMVNPSVEFFVSRKNDYIIFRPVNWVNSFHISFKTPEGEWDMPIPLTQFFKDKWDGKGIGPNVSPDGKYFFFGKDGDFYWVKTDFIETLRKYKRPY